MDENYTQRYVDELYNLAQSSLFHKYYKFQG